MYESQSVQVWKWKCESVKVWRCESMIVSDFHWVWKCKSESVKVKVWKCVTEPPFWWQIYKWGQCEPTLFKYWLELPFASTKLHIGHSCSKSVSWSRQVANWYRMVGGPPANGGASEIILVSENAIDLRGCARRPGVEIGCWHDSALTPTFKWRCRAAHVAKLQAAHEGRWKTWFEQECPAREPLLCLVQPSWNQIWTQRVQRKSILQKNWSDSSEWVSIPHGQGTARRWRWSFLHSD